MITHASVCGASTILRTVATRSARDTTTWPGRSAFQASLSRIPAGQVTIKDLDAVSELRNAGIAAELYLGRAGMKAQMKYADRRGAPAVVILGGDEIAAGQVTVKDLDAGRARAAEITDNEAWKAERPGQVVAARADLVATVRRIVDVAHTDA